jgi:hypothetical protein
MKKIFILLLITLTYISCNVSKKESFYGGVPELIKYRANYYETEFSYEINYGDTAQMALKTNTIFISPEKTENGLIINVKVIHP